MNYEEMVKEIRASENLGRGSCSWVDECLTDEELTKQLRDLVEGDRICQPMKKPTAAKVIRELTRINRAVLERM
jgi:hypothetical protein